MERKDQTITFLVNNRPDVLAKIAGVFSARSFNIESISANITMNPEITKIIIVTRGDTATVTKIKNQTKKLIDILEVSHLKEKSSLQREMILVKVKLTNENRGKVMEVIRDYNCRLITVDADNCVLEATGNKSEIKNILKRLERLGIEDLSRSGILAL
ncbi:MAG: acetolactate synthase small subunit [Syntrophales bacterium]|nr:acetolactate synthase small subunit [Syntrophales bacterium]